MIGLAYTPVGTFTFTLHTLPSSLGNESCTLPMFHFPRIAFVSATITTSSTCTFLFSVVHFFLGTSSGNTSRAHLFQNACCLHCVNHYCYLGNIGWKELSTY